MAIEDYNDIINLPYEGRKGGGLSMYQRAAQFAPFAALTGHDAAIRETARLTDSLVDLDDERCAQLNVRMMELRNHIGELPEVTVVFFRPDSRKSGGAYVSYFGKVRAIDDYEHLLIMHDNTRIPLASVFSIDGPMFDDHLIP